MRHEQGAVRQGEPLRQRWVRFLPRWEKTRTGGVGGPALSPLRMPVVFLLALLASMAVACGDEDATPTPDASGQAPVTPFTDIARLDPYPPRIFQVWNDRPGVVIFDYDRDGDMDMYVTQQGAYENRLYQNGDDGVFTDVAEEAGVEAREYHSTGAVACDFDNDGFQDLYVGSWGNPEDGLDFRSPSDVQGNADRLFRNKGDGTFEDITDSAFGEAVNVRSAASAACADVDGDGWLDIYVGNLGAEDFRVFTTPNHPGHYNVLYRNNGDLTFTDVSERAGVRGPQILMLDPDGEPVLFEDPDTGEKYQGYDPTYRDSMGNRVGEPTGQTHSVLFFDYDEDGDPDLWVANDGDRLHVYRNDSSPGDIRFTPVAGAMGIDKVGSWMGFAVADYDEDGDIDVFVANVGHHLRRWPRQERPGGSCGYHDAFPWGTCLHLLLRNGGVLQDVPGVGPVGTFENVASLTEVAPSPFMPPTSLDPDTLDSSWDVPTGLAAYDFGFGATFFDSDNDGDQDLYWLGSTLGRGESSRGHIFPGAGRMLRGDGTGSFEDITVRSRLLDILKVDYSSLSRQPRFRRRGAADRHAIPRERQGTGPRRPERRRVRRPCGHQQQRPDHRHRRVRGGSPRAGVRVAERRRRQSLDQTAPQRPHGCRRHRKQRGRRRRARACGDPTQARRAQSPDTGGPCRVQLPVHGQRGPRVRRRESYRGRGDNHTCGPVVESRCSTIFRSIRSC